MKLHVHCQRLVTVVFSVMACTCADDVHTTPRRRVASWCAVLLCCGCVVVGLRLLSHPRMQCACDVTAGLMTQRDVLVAKHRVVDMVVVVVDAAMLPAAASTST